MTAPSMSSTTAQMLSEIGVGTAAELIMGVRYTTNPPGPTFIPDLDALLLTARPHAGGSSLRRGDLLELVGQSGSGKTALGVFLLMTTLLPPSLEVTLGISGHKLTVPLGGRGAPAALLSPPSHRSTIPRLAKGMRAHIRACASAAFPSHSSSSSEAEISAAMEECLHASLSRLLILSPRPTPIGWASALRRVMEEDEDPDVVLCDGFADGFWPQRWAEEQAAPPAGTQARRKEVRGAGDAGMRDVWEAVTALRRERGAVVVLSVQGLRLIPNTPFYKPHLPPPYPSPFARDDAGVPTQAQTQTQTQPQNHQAWPLTIQLTLLGRARALQLPAETLLADALRARLSPTAGGGVQVFDAVVRVPGGLGPAATLAGARWSFGVAGHGLVPFTQVEEGV